MNDSGLPIFPLPLVLTPGGRLPLRIFEPRYLAMVKWCMKHDQGFVVVAQDGDGFAAVGGLARIVDFDQLPDGCLGLTAVGEGLVELSEPRQDDDGLWWGEVGFLEPERDVEPMVEHADLVNLLASLSEHPAVKQLSLEIDYESLSEVSLRLVELLPFELDDKQRMLELGDPEKRSEALREALKSLPVER